MAVMKSLKHILIENRFDAMAATIYLFMLSASLHAGERQDTSVMHQRVLQTVTQYVQAQTAGYPGKVNVLIQPLDSRIKIPECLSLEAFTMQGVRLWGRTHVGVRCQTMNHEVDTNADSSTSKPWSIYVQADVQVWGEYAVTAMPVSQGVNLTEADIIMQRGDLSKLPYGVVTDLAQAIGKQASMHLPLGTVLRPDLLKAVAVIMQGQTVQLSSRGPGFVVTTDGTALKAAQVGQVVDVKVSSGQIIKGVAQASGKVEVNF